MAMTDLTILCEERQALDAVARAIRDRLDSDEQVDVEACADWLGSYEGWLTRLDDVNKQTGRAMDIVTPALKLVTTYIRCIRCPAKRVRVVDRQMGRIDGDALARCVLTILNSVHSLKRSAARLMSAGSGLIRQGQGGQ